MTFLPRNLPSPTTQYLNGFLFLSCTHTLFHEILLPAINISSTWRAIIPWIVPFKVAVMLFYHFNGASISPYTHFVARPNRSLRFPPVYWLTTPQKFVRDLCVMVRRSDTPSASAMSTACLQLSVMSLPVHSLSESNFCRCSHSKSESWNPFTPIRISVPSRLVHSDPAATSWRCPCWPTWKLVFSRFRWLISKVRIKWGDVRKGLGRAKCFKTEYV